MASFVTPSHSRWVDGVHPVPVLHLGNPVRKEPGRMLVLNPYLNCRGL